MIIEPMDDFWKQMLDELENTTNEEWMQLIETTSGTFLKEWFMLQGEK